MQRRLCSAVFESGTKSRLLGLTESRGRERERDANPYFYHDAVSVVSV